MCIYCYRPLLWNIHSLFFDDSTYFFSLLFSSFTLHTLCIILVCEKYYYVYVAIERLRCDVYERREKWKKKQNKIKQHTEKICVYNFCLYGSFSLFESFYKFLPNFFHILFFRMFYIIVESELKNSSFRMFYYIFSRKWNFIRSFHAAASYFSCTITIHSHGKRHRQHYRKAVKQAFHSHTVEWEEWEDYNKLYFSGFSLWAAAEQNKKEMDDDATTTTLPDYDYSGRIFVIHVCAK
jgi:hypothetical protein